MSYVAPTTLKKIINGMKWWGIIFALFLVAGAGAESIQSIQWESSMLWNLSKSVPEYTYPQYVDAWGTSNIHYQAHGGWWVNSTDLTWEIREGRCSEFALIYEQMLSYHIPAKIVHGYVMVNGTEYGHDTVLYTSPDNSTHFIDNANQWGFHMTGYGLTPGEYVVGG